MGILFDLIFVLIIFGFLYLGSKKGLIATVFSLASYIASIILSFVMYKPVKAFVSKLPFIETVRTAMNDKISPILSGGTEKLPFFLKESASKSAAELSATLVDTLTNAFLFLICVIAVMILIKLFLKASSLTAKAIKKLPVIKGLDGLLGLVLGGVNGILIVNIVLLAGMLFLTGGNYEWFTDSVDSSYITKYFYENNIIMNLIVNYL